MAFFSRKEDQADLWLREHDPYFTSPDKMKSKKVKYPYDTPEMERRKSRAEIPISNLNSYQKVIFKEIAGSYDEEGNFDL